MSHTLFDFSVIIALILHFAIGENIDQLTRYASDSNFASVENTKNPDQNSEATLFGESEPFGGTQDGGNYFMYQHVPQPDHYEFAYKRGNEHHFRQHHEKAAPHKGHFKTQTRWGDKHGGYGEHYWDYNHGGDAHEEGSSNEEIFDPSQTQDEKTIAYASTPSRSVDSRTPLQVSETHKTEQKERKKYYNSKPNKPKYEDIRQKKKYSETESPQITAEQDYYDIPKVKPRPYDKDYSPAAEAKKAQLYQNVNLYSQGEEFPVIYDTTRTPSTTNYDQVQSLKSLFV
ncbi:uncharacterized protein LOC135842142 [Planococcus citri]|uniref:uncharacterized protein LOC135842142 n=1 Tax=Planococcus citri TaxID=170843 RepID=UPI0031F954FE